MDAILSRLTEIEDAANRILSRTTEQKKTLADEMALRTRTYDAELEEAQRRYIEEEKQSLQRQREEKLVSLRSSMQEQMEQMDEKFSGCHTEMAREIMKRILEV